MSKKDNDNNVKDDYAPIQAMGIEEDNEYDENDLEQHTGEPKIHERKSRMTNRDKILSKYTRSSYVFKYYILPNIFLIGAFVFFQLSLEGCKGNSDVCLDMLLNSKLFDRVKYLVFFSSLLFNLQIVLMVYYFSVKIANYVIFIAVFVVVGFVDDNEDNIQNHGWYNKMYLLFLIGIFALITFTVIEALTMITNKTISKKLKILRIALLCSIIGIIYFVSDTYLKTSCSKWNEGFKGSKIDNSNTCKISTPDICYQNILSGYFDFSHLLNDSCENINNLKDPLFSLIKYPNTNTTKIGFPPTNGYKIDNTTIFKNNFQKIVFEELIDMNNSTFPDFYKNQADVFVTYEGKAINGKEIGKAEIKLNRLELAEGTRKRRFEEKYVNKTMVNKVIILFIDSVSRAHFKRKLPKTHAWIEQFYKSDDKASYESFQFLKYHGIGPNKTLNMIPAMFGRQFNTNVDSNYFIKFFIESGFMTASVGTMCNREIVHLNKIDDKLDFAPYDHEFYSFFCDPNLTPISSDNSNNMWNGPYSYRRKCLYGKSTTEWAMDYSKQFLGLYKDSPRILRINIASGHEGTGEVIKYDDDEIVNFLKYIEKEGYVKDNILYIVSDRNYNMDGPFKNNNLDDWKHELSLPHLSLVLDKNMKNFKDIKENLVANENVFVTPYDFHASLLSIVDKDNGNQFWGNSFFFEKLSTDTNLRSCPNILIQKEWCRCTDHTYEKQDPNK